MDILEIYYVRDFLYIHVAKLGISNLNVQTYIPKYIAAYVQTPMEGDVYIRRLDPANHQKLQNSCCRRCLYMGRTYISTNRYLRIGRPPAAFHIVCLDYFFLFLFSLLWH